MFISVVIPTYNRRPILEKCLLALESQKLSDEISGFEVVVVDDGSTDDTPAWLMQHSLRFPHVVLIEQDHAGPAQGRNLGVENSQGEIIVFIDSDLVVKETFLSNHIQKLTNSWLRNGNRLCFTYGSVINTSNFDDPTSEPFKITDSSMAYFATGNVAIDKNILCKSGLFDTSFHLYGWEDLELGERLRQMGVKIIKCPSAIGFHWHPALSLDQIPSLIRVEKERAKMGLVFYRKHPTLRVRFIIQFTIIHRLLWDLLTLYGLINERNIRPFLAFLIRKGYSSFAMELLRLPLNRIAVLEMYRQAHQMGIN